MSHDSINSRNTVSESLRKKTRWSAEDINYLREHYADDDLDSISKHLSRTKSSIRTKAHELDIKKSVWSNVGKERNKEDEYFWTDEEIEFLREHYATMSTDKIAERLNRCKNGIYGKARELGLKKNRNAKICRNAWSQKELTYIQDNYLTRNVVLIALELNRSVDSIYKVAGERFGLHRKRGNQSVKYVTPRMEGFSWSRWLREGEGRTGVTNGNYRNKKSGRYMPLFTRRPARYSEGEGIKETGFVAEEG